jgi:acetyl-CoA carboxylase carboxyltransferase component
MGTWMDGYLEKKTALDEEALRGGGQERIDVQHGLGKLTARERIDKLADPGSFRELGSNVRDPEAGARATPKPSPGDGVVMGLAEIDGRQVFLYSLDFTVMSGAIGDQGIWKIAELVQMAGQEQVPLIGIIDSAGSRLGFKRGAAGLSGMGQLIRNYCLYSGIIPQITMILGPCTGPMAQIATLSDILIMNEHTGFLWLGGEIESDDAGTADFHMARSGQCDLTASGD